MEAIEGEWLAMFSRAISKRPVCSNPAGLQEVCHDLCKDLEDLGFAVERHASPGHQEVIIAKRAPPQVPPPNTPLLPPPCTPLLPPPSHPSTPSGLAG